MYMLNNKKEIPMEGKHRLRVEAIFAFQKKFAIKAKTLFEVVKNFDYLVFIFRLHGRQSDEPEKYYMQRITHQKKERFYLILFLVISIGLYDWLFFYNIEESIKNSVFVLGEIYAGLSESILESIRGIPKAFFSFRGWVSDTFPLYTVINTAIWVLALLLLKHAVGIIQGTPIVILFHKKIIASYFFLKENTVGRFERAYPWLYHKLHATVDFSSQIILFIFFPFGIMAIGMSFDMSYYYAFDDFYLRHPYMVRGVALVLGYGMFRLILDPSEFVFNFTLLQFLENEACLRKGSADDRDNESGDEGDMEPQKSQFLEYFFTYWLIVYKKYLKFWEFYRWLTNFVPNLYRGVSLVVQIILSVISTAILLAFIFIACMFSITVALINAKIYVAIMYLFFALLLIYSKICVIVLFAEDLKKDIKNLVVCVTGALNSCVLFYKQTYASCVLFSKKLHAFVTQVNALVVGIPNAIKEIPSWFTTLEYLLLCVKSYLFVFFSDTLVAKKLFFLKNFFLLKVKKFEENSPILYDIALSIWGVLRVVFRHITLFIIAGLFVLHFKYGNGKWEAYVYTND